MTAPNLLATSSVVGKTALVSLSTTTSNVITNSSGSSTVDKLNNVILTNISSSTVYANIMLNRSSTLYYIGGNIAVPGYSTLTLLGKDTSLYLEEGDVLQANASATLSMAASYELMS